MQYSLRALLVTMTLVAIGLAAWHEWTEYQERQLGALLDRHIAAMDAQDFEAALRISRRAAELYPDNAVAQNMVGQARVGFCLKNGLPLPPDLANAGFYCPADEPPPVALVERCEAAICSHADEESPLALLVERCEAAMEARDFEQADRIARNAVELYPKEELAHKSAWAARFALRLSQRLAEQESDPYSQLPSP
jgi:tetratricopeptide (TPR) repeat protein